MNAAAKVKDEVTEVELDNPSAPGGNPDAGLRLRVERRPRLHRRSRSAAAAR